jgi:translation initiation factor 2 subunit 1
MENKAQQERQPRMSELVIAQVSKITNFGAYCKLLEYNNMEVFLPIREISSGWIKNIRMFVHEGQKLVCRVTIFDKEKGTIDISLKKVTQKEAKEKMGAHNLEKRLEALFNQMAKSAKNDEARTKLIQTILSEFGTYSRFAQAAINNTEEFKKSKITKPLKDLVIKTLEANMKKRDVEVSYILKLTTMNTRTGASDLRAIFTEMEKTGTDVTYISAPKYRLYATGKDYIEAENKIKKAMDALHAKEDKNYEVVLEKEKLKREKESILEQSLAK